VLDVHKVGRGTLHIEFVNLFAVVLNILLDQQLLILESFELKRVHKCRLSRADEKVM